MALRDAAEHVFDDVTDHVVTDASLGVRLHIQSPSEGRVSFDWPEAGRRITYLWDRKKVRLSVDPIDAPEAPSSPRPPGRSGAGCCGWTGSTARSGCPGPTAACATRARNTACGS